MVYRKDGEVDGEAIMDFLNAKVRRGCTRSCSPEWNEDVDKWEKVKMEMKRELFRKGERMI